MNRKRAISRNGGVVICVLDSTNIVREMERIHKTSAVVTAALGRLLTAASLMSSWLKNDKDTMTLRIDGKGPAGILLAVTNSKGDVRGYAQHPLADVPMRADGKLDVGGVVGTSGTLAVVRDLGMNKPYIGQVPLVSGEIAEDVTSYYANSEQTPTVCALGVLVNKDLSVKTAGGILLQLLPGASEDEISRLEKNITNLPPITSLLQEENGMQKIIDAAMAGFEPEILIEEEVGYKCYCSEERTERMLISLGVEELKTLLGETPITEVACHFCDKKYHISIQKLLDEITKN